MIPDDLTLWRCYSVQTMAKRWNCTVDKARSEVAGKPCLVLDDTRKRYPWWAVAGLPRPLPSAEVVRAVPDVLPPGMALAGFLRASWDAAQVGEFLDVTKAQVVRAWDTDELPVLQWSEDPYYGALPEWIIQCIWEQT